MVSFNLALILVPRAKMKSKHSVLLVASLQFLFLVIRGAPDNYGRNFLLAFGPNFKQPVGEPVDFCRISVAAIQNCTVRVEAPSLGRNTSHTVTAGSTFMVDLPPAIRVPKSGGVGNYAVRISSTKDVAVFGLNTMNASQDAFTVFPTDVHGPRYDAVHYGYIYKTFILIAAGTNNTRIAVKMKTSGWSIPFQGNTYFSGSWLNSTLNAFDVLGITVTADDITGTEIYSNSPISVFSGAQCSEVPAYTGKCDHLAEQIPPSNTLGTQFITVPLAFRKTGDYYRLLSTRHSNAVYDSYYASTSILKSGDFLDTNVKSLSPIYFSSSQPSILMQISKGQDADNTGIDPFMMMVTPTQQYASSYWFTTPDGPNTTYTTFVSVAILASNVKDLYIDRSPIPVKTWNSVPGTPYVGASFAITPGFHRICHFDATKTFGLMVYGNDARYWNSYGYPAGSRLAPVADVCAPSGSKLDDGLDNDCDGRIDEEFVNGEDDDGDGLVDEDITTPHFQCGYFKTTRKTAMNNVSAPQVTDGKLGTCTPIDPTLTSWFKLELPWKVMVSSVTIKGSNLHDFRVIIGREENPGGCGNTFEISGEAVYGRYRSFKTPNHANGEGTVVCNRGIVGQFVYVIFPLPMSSLVCEIILE